MPDIDARIFTFALHGFLFFGAANLTVELMTSFILLCKKLKATVRAPYDLQSGTLKPGRLVDSSESEKLNATVLNRLLALTPNDRQIINSILDKLSNRRLEDIGTTSTHTADSQEPEYLGWVRVSRNVSSSDLTH